MEKSNSVNQKAWYSISLLFFFSVLLTTFSFAQGKTVTGTVVDSKTQSPLVGVTVSVKGTNIATTTNEAGNFTINVTDNQRLIFSSIGFESQEITPGASSKLSIALVTAPQELADVVVVGFGTQKKATLTGSVAQITGEELMKGKSSSNAALALQGEVSGLVVTRTTSRPGNEGIGIQIRGDISVNGVGPLILLDGLEISQSQFSSINANDIDNISVLKDAAAAIFGTKAAGGVILITTKKGKKGDAKITYNGQYQLNHPNSFPLANLSEYSQMLYQAANNGAPSFVDAGGVTQQAAPNYRFFTKQQMEDLVAGTFPLSPNFFVWYDGKSHNLADVSNFDAIYGVTNSLRNDLSISGGNDKVTYRTSVSYNNERSPIATTYDGAKTYNFRTNLGYKVNDMLSTDFIVSFGNQFVNTPTQGVGTGVHDPQIFPLFNPLGQYYDEFGANNPLALLNTGGRTKETDQNFRLGAKLTLNLDRYVKGLSLTYNGNYSSDVDHRVERKTSVTLYGWDGSIASSPTTLLTSGVKLFDTKVQFQNHVLQANYLHSIGKHNFGLLVGATAEETQTNLYYAARTNMASDDLDDINTGDVTTQVTGGNQKQSDGSTFNTGANAVGLISYIGRFNYNYKGIYLLEALGRRDGSSRLAPDFRWKNFYGASVGVRLSELSFVKNLNIFNNLKIRASYGETGSVTGIGAYDYLSNMSVGTALFGSTPAWANTAWIGSLTTAERTWERVSTTNYAIDFAVLNSRLSGTVELYRRLNTNMLVNITYPAVLGASAPKTNSGDFTNNGYDISINWKDKIASKIRYNVGLMFWDSRSTVSRMEGKTAIVSGLNAIIQGKPLNSIYAYNTGGYLQSEADVLEYYNQYGFASSSNQLTYKSNTLLSASPFRSANRLVPGSVKRIDLNGDGVINTSDLAYQGDANPHLNFGINLGLSYNNFDFSAFLQGVGQQYIVRTGYLSYPFASWFTDQNSTFLGKTWTSKNTNAQYPIMTQATNQAVGTWNYNLNNINVINSHYMRAKVISLGYSLPNSIINKIGLERVRFSVTGNDLFVLSNVKDGMDPEMQSSASTTIIPYTKTVVFGLQITF